MANGRGVTGTEAVERVRAGARCPFWLDQVIVITVYIKIYIYG